MWEWIPVISTLWHTTPQFRQYSLTKIWQKFCEINGLCSTTRIDYNVCCFHEIFCKCKLFPYFAKSCNIQQRRSTTTKLFDFTNFFPENRRFLYFKENSVKVIYSSGKFQIPETEISHSLHAMTSFCVETFYIPNVVWIRHKNFSFFWNISWNWFTLQSWIVG